VRNEILKNQFVVLVVFLVIFIRAHATLDSSSLKLNLDLVASHKLHANIMCMITVVL